MRVLLDTHVWLWRLLEPDRLPAAVAAVLDDQGTEICLSPISVWETLVLARRGRLEPSVDRDNWVRSALEASRPTMMPLTHAIAIESEQLEGFRSRDPADRFLVATARVEGLRLASADRAMLEYPGVETVSG